MSDSPGQPGQASAPLQPSSTARFGSTAEAAPTIDLDVAPTLEAPTEPSPDPSVPSTPPVPPPSVESTRHLLGASFELLTRTSEDMRRASFYIGLIVLGTVGPLAITSWAFEVVSIHKTQRQLDALLGGGMNAWLTTLGVLAFVGLIVAFVESRTMAVAILGGHLARRPITVRQALARSRMIFWRAIVASVVVSVPVAVAQGLVGSVFENVLGTQADVSLVSSTLVAAIVGAPLAYVLSGVVLGDVEPFEAIRRSFRVFRARKLAAALVAVFETIAFLLVFLGLSAGLELALRVFDALGLGANSGPAGLALVTIGVVVGVFALGTLIYTALAISVAPQVVMFVGLTRATFGLDHVRPGGDHDPTLSRPGRRRFRWITIPMLLAFALGGVGLAASLAILVR